MSALRYILASGTGFIFALFKFHKTKILFFMFSVLVFFVLLFPYEDLSDLVTQQVATATNGQVNLEFNGMGLAFPIGIELTEVEVKTVFWPPTLKASRLAVKPWLGSVGLFLDGLWQGELSAYASYSTKDKNKLTAEIELKADQLDLEDLSEFAMLPLIPKGRLSGEVPQLKIETSGSADRGGSNSPLAISIDSLTFKIEGFKLRDSTVPTPFGPIPLPNLELSQILLNGRYLDDVINILPLKVGSPGDALYGDVWGEMNLELRSIRGQLIPMLNSFELNFDLAMQKKLETEMGTYLDLLDDMIGRDFVKRTSDGRRYCVKATSRRSGQIPEYRQCGQKQF